MNRIILLIAALCLAGCGPLATFRLTRDVSMNVCSVEAGDTDWKVTLDFERDASAPDLDLVQRVALVDGRRVVETFKFRGKATTTTDTHFMTELTGVSDSRSMYVTLGSSTDADWTNSGFAMLIGTADGAYATQVDALFNESYRKKHTISGVATLAGRIEGVWSILWLPGKLRIITPSGELLLDQGSIITLELEGITID